MILLIAYASVAVVMIGVQFHRLNKYWTWSYDGSNDGLPWFGASVATGVLWPFTFAYIVARWLSSRRPPACACGLRARKGGKFCGRCGSKIGAKA